MYLLSLLMCLEYLISRMEEHYEIFNWLASLMSIVDIEPPRRNLRTLLNIADLHNVNLKKFLKEFGSIRNGMRIHIST